MQIAADVDADFAFGRSWSAIPKRPKASRLYYYCEQLQQFQNQEHVVMAYTFSYPLELTERLRVDPGIDVP